jgi:hypothetical protein
MPQQPTVTLTEEERRILETFVGMSLLIEDIAQLIIGLTSRHDHFPRDAIGELGEDLRIQ